jgi:hypothetical protein
MRKEGWGGRGEAEEVNSGGLCSKYKNIQDISTNYVI